MIITHKGLVAMARIFVSCNPLHGSIVSRNQEYLIKNSQKGVDVKLSDFEKDLPLPDPYNTYRKIAEFARSIGKKSIDDDVIYKFFGGGGHIAKVMSDIQRAQLGKKFARKILFAHLLIPVTLMDVDNGYCAGIYKNGAETNTVRVVNLVPLFKKIPHEEALELSVGQVVLVHYASIISADFSEDVRDYLLAEQVRNSEFTEACESIKEIDYKSFWNLCEWTENIIQERSK